MSSPNFSFLKPVKLRHSAQPKDPEAAGLAPTVRAIYPRAFRLATQAGATALALALAVTTAQATLPPWLQHVIGASSAESALYRLMHLPGADSLYPRPPKESQTQLATLIAAKPDPDLYALRARADEQALDLPTAESDWKLYAEKKATPQAQLELANFYSRRLQTEPEAAILRQVAAAPIPASETYLSPENQLAWRTNIRLINLLNIQAVPEPELLAAYQSFEQHYPTQPSVYAHELQFLLDGRDYPQAEALITRYHQQNPADITFPIRAHALIVLRRDGPDQALAVYDSAFQPLWPQDLIQSYFALLAQTHRQRTFVGAARAKLAADPAGPESLNALARIFYYDQQAQRFPQAQLTLDQFRVTREAGNQAARNLPWSPADLYTLAQLSALTSNNAEVARYNFALASTPGSLPANINGGAPAAQAGLAALTHLLLTAADPDSSAKPLALGAGNLTLYRDIATLDQGPGYWNGILSLWLNGTNPESQYTDETAKAQTYFHRSKAAELLTQLDQRFPNAPERPALHAELIATQAQYGESAAVIAAGKTYLADFPNAPASITVAGLLADAYANQKDTASEFALYDSLLASLAAQTHGQPLSAAPQSTSTPESPASTGTVPASTDTSDLTSAYTPTRATLPAAAQYQQILDRYLARLVAAKQIPQALTLLRRELDRNPGDPALYERLATFLEQNNLAAQQGEVYKLAIAKFQQPTYYDKLARFYLREKQRQAFATLTKQVVDIFSGTDLDKYFALVTPADTPTDPGPQLALQLNLYAQHRFPHDLVFTRNLLTAYQTGPNPSPTANSKAYDALIRRQWYASEDLTTQFFEYLSRTGKLQSELASLQPATNPGAPALAIADLGSTNPAALHELSGLQIFTSHYEQATAPLTTLTALYPADPTLNDQAISLFRSLSYLDPTPATLGRAVSLEQNLLTAAPDSPERLATLGDLYAEATAFRPEAEPAALALASPSWRRIPSLHPGTPAGFLTSATIFWDYFQYNNALEEIHTARTRFSVPTLYGYEAGAIEENRRDLPAAIAEYVAVAIQPTTRDSEYPQVQSALAWATIDALIAPPSDAADSNLQSTLQAFFGTQKANRRLLQLARRPATAPLVDQATLAAINAHPTDSAALDLRADVLTAQHRGSEITPLLTAALARAQTEDEAAAIGTLAQAHNLTATYEAALTRQAALTIDPVQRIQLQYTLAASLEARKQTSQAQAIYASVYTANPRLLGVVRTTTDFYARTRQPTLAINTLLDAAKVATPSLARAFTLEAASRANDAGNPTQARQLALTLLPATPYDPQVLAVIATSYAKANDSAGLKTFYLAQIQSATNAPNLSRDDRKADVALLRRGLIPALTQLKDYEGAETQYIALLSAFPEDAPTTQQAALYAIRYQRQQQLVAFLETTVKQSPQDSRFAIDLAQVQTTYGNLPAALSAYDSAIAVRKDRADLYQNRAQLELQLAVAGPTVDSAKLDAAADDFTHLYGLTYHDPQYQVRLAEIRVRQGRSADAVKALRTAYIEGHPTSGPIAAANAFTVAAQLATWNLLPEARTYAEQGIHLAGPQLLINSDTTCAQTYARILTRLGHPETALTTLTAARRAALAQHPSGYADADPDTRKSLVDQQTQTVNQSLNTAVQTIGQTVQTYFTPEQRQTYATILDTLHATDATLAIQAAATASFADREANWRRQQLQTAPVDADSTATNLAAYTTLENNRLAFGELGHTLEAYAGRLAPDNRDPIRQQAATAYRNAGDFTAELRISRSLTLAADPALRDRYLDLLLAHSPAALAALAQDKDASLADAAVNYTMAHGTFQQVNVVLGARGRALPAVWTPANLALAGVYLDGDRATTGSAFIQSLRANDTIAQHLATRANPKTTLTGDLWFDEAARFGLFLNLAPASPANEAEDYLPAGLESSPSSPAEYLDLARTYAGARNVPAARAEFAHVLELAPTGSDAIAAHDEQAVLLQQTGNQTAAVAEWRAGLDLLRQLGDQSYPERFYTGFASITHHLALNHLNLQSELEAVLRPYLARNGNYRSNELLHAAYDASPTPAQGITFVITLADAASDPDQVLRDLETASWLPEPQLENLLLRRLALANRTDPISADTSEPTPDYGTPEAATGKRAIQQKLALLYLETGNYPALANLLETISAAERTGTTFRKAELLLAAHNNTLAPALLAATPTDTPSLGLEPYTAAAQFLAAPHSHVAPTQSALANALLLDQFLFDRDQAAHTLTAADFLTLAQAHLATGDLPGALTTLQSLAAQPAFNTADPTTTPGAPGLSSETWVSTSNLANVDAAAALLESTHHLAEAVPFLQSLAASVPWSAPYRLRLAEAQQAAEPATATRALTAIAKDSTAPYATRAQAAEHLKQPTAQDLGSAELNLLAQPTQTSAAAAHPGFTTAQLYLAVQPATSLADRITLLHQALAAAPRGLTADQARLDLFLAEAATTTPPADVIALRNLVLNTTASTPSDDASEDDASADTPEDASEASTDTSTDDSTPDTDATTPSAPTPAQPAQFESTPATLPALALSLDVPTQIQLAETLSRLALNADQSPQQAVAWLQLAITLDAASPTPDATLKPRLAALQAQIALDKINKGRRPVFHTDLTQHIAVRPRLTLAEAARLEAQ